jgi:hypothetical protein
MRIFVPQSFKMAAPLVFDDSIIPDDILTILLSDSDDEDEVLHYLMHKPNLNTTSTYDSTIPRFNLEEFDAEKCKVFFRFVKEDLYELAGQLRLPDEFVLSNRIRVDRMVALCMTLRRLSYPTRLVDLEHFFGWPKSTISMIVNDTINHIYETFKGKITNLNQEWIVNRMQLYADKIHRKGAPLTNCFGFVDGTVRPMCRPMNLQRIVYNGHKRVHML